MQRLIRPKYLFLSILLIVTSLLLSDCEEEKPQQRDYPRLATMPVSNITEEGATFNVDLYSLGTEEITEFGFVWGNTSYLSYLSADRKLISIPASAGTFSVEVYSTFQEGIEYTVMPYITTSGHVVYGAPVKFKSLGSLGPIITGFEPGSAEWGDTIWVSGKNFSWVAGQNIIKFNQAQCPIISSTDTSIVTLISLGVNEIENQLSVELAGNKALFSEKKFYLIPPVMKDFYPKKASWGDTLFITGNRLSTISLLNNNLKLGAFSCQIINVTGDSVIKAKIPYETDILKSPVTINLNGYIVTGHQDFELLPPFFTFSPGEGTWKDQIIINGKFNVLASRHKIYFNNVMATISSATARTIVLKVPDNLVDIESNIIYKAAPFEISSTTPFRLKPPVINLFSPTSGISGTTVTIKGKYFGGPIKQVKFGEIAGTIYGITDSTITTRVPTGGFGPVEINVTAGIQSATSGQMFNITNPKITSFYPVTGTYNDEITIEGANFTSNISVRFGNTTATKKSVTSNSIVAIVPLYMDSIPDKIWVSTGAVALSDESFVLIPPEIISVNPESVHAGMDITLTGKYFNPISSYNQVFFGTKSLALKSCSVNQIVASLPSNLTPGFYRISVKVSGYKRFFPVVFEIKPI